MRAAIQRSCTATARDFLSLLFATVSMSMARWLVGALSVLLAGNALAQNYTYLTQFGTQGSGNRQFQFVLGVAIDPASRNLVVTDVLNHRVQVFDSAGGYLSQFGTLGSGNGQFSEPQGVAIDPSSHNIVVVDSQNHRVQIFSSAGLYLRQFGTSGSGNGQFIGPAGVAIDPTSHNIVVTDFSRVQIFSSAGAYLSHFGSYGTDNGQFTNARGVAIDPASHNIVVTDLNNNRVQIFNSAGVYLSQFGSAGSGDGQFSSPSGIAIDPTSHNIVVVDNLGDRVEIFNSAGAYLSQLGRAGSANGQFQFPHDVAIDPSTHNIVVTDFGNYRVQIFALTPPPESQTLYLNFGQVLAPVPSAAFSWWGNRLSNTVASYTKPDAGLNLQEIATVVQYVSAVLAPFKISVTTTKPTSGQYSTVYIGGDRTEVGAPYTQRLVDGGFIGVAQQIDLGNADSSDVAYVFNKLSNYSPRDSASYLPAVALGIVHEAGHILGLQHVVTDGDIMRADIGRAGFTIADDDRNIDTPNGGCQNDYQQLGRNVGLRTGSPSPILLFPCEFLGQHGPVALALNWLGGVGLHGAILATILDGDSGPNFYSLGDFAPNSASVLHIDAPIGESLALFGSSSPGGPIDTIASPVGVDVLNLRTSLSDITPGDLLIPVDGSGSTSFNLFHFTSGVGFSEFGSASISLDTVPPPTTTNTAVEYFHAQFGHYFVTAIPDEIAKLDAGVFVGWQRTGQTFNVYPLNAVGTANVCRFFSTSFAPKSSHFYTPYATECAIEKQNPDWQFEGEVFAVGLPDAVGNCGAGTEPLYRMYNNGQGGAPNHRYTTSLVTRSAMLSQGWIPEGAGAIGVIACVPI